MSERLISLADALRRAEAERAPIPPLTDDHADLTVQDAYRIQQLNVEKRIAMGDRVVGHKIGLTSKPMQLQLGVSEPDFGHLFQSMWFESGSAIDFPLIQPKVEPEIAFILSDDLVGPGVDLHRVLAATRAVVPAIEVIDSRIADWKIRLVDTIADNASAGCFVLGHLPTPVSGVDLETVGGVLKVNGEVVQTGAGAAVMGHPAKAVAWLANTLTELGTPLRAGHVVLSGAVSAAVPIHPGDRVQLSFGPLGAVEFVWAKGAGSE
ncbi:2-keto-4-pentenoate hydratase [Alicyclobacillus fructus]|uniref:2-keto-4-pentenoate hydratase n=1 Tax=Alicyclobacillus fructus TaxID=2816082 RepID=UPI001A8EA484|nr:fumarylacetoacetate hydrolase family protein [Alicyclobacillus fructus]